MHCAEVRVARVLLGSHEALGGLAGAFSGPNGDTSQAGTMAHCMVRLERWPEVRL